MLSTDDEDYDAGMRGAVSDSMQTHKSIVEEKDKDNEEVRCTHASRSQLNLEYRYLKFCIMIGHIYM